MCTFNFSCKRVSLCDIMCNYLSSVAFLKFISLALAKSPQLVNRFLILTAKSR